MPLQYKHPPPKASPAACPAPAQVPVQVQMFQDPLSPEEAAEIARNLDADTAVARSHATYSIDLSDSDTEAPSSPSGDASRLAAQSSGDKVAAGEKLIYTCGVRRK